MPSTSEKQANFMRAVAKNPSFAQKVKVPQAVGAEFLRADTGKKHYDPNYKRGAKGPYSTKGDNSMNAKKGVRKMQDGGMTAPMTAPRMPTLPSQANARATTALGNRGMMGQPTVPPAPSDVAARANMGRGMEMRNIPTLPDQASQRARDMMAARLSARNPITTPGAPVDVLPEVAVLPPAAYKKGGKIKRMAGGGGTNPRKGGALYGKGTNFNPNMQAGGKVPTAPTLPSQASSKASDAMSRFAGAGNRPGYKKGGMPKVKKYAAGGSVSKRADGCCMKGRTKGRMR